jgi:hypothetical protein
MAELVDFWLAMGIVIMMLLLVFFVTIIGYCVIRFIKGCFGCFSDEAYNANMKAYLEGRKHRKLSYYSDTVGEGPINSSQS